MPSRATDQSGRRDRRMRWSASGRPRELWRGANLGRRECLRTAATALAAPQAKPHAIRCRGSRAQATSARMSPELEASSRRSSRPDRSIVGPGIKIKRRLPLTRGRERLRGDPKFDLDHQDIEAERKITMERQQNNFPRSTAPEMQSRRRGFAALTGPCSTLLRSATFLYPIISN